MSKYRFLEILEKTKIICVIRTKLNVDLRPAFDALVGGGVTLIEITSTCPDFDKNLTVYRKYINSIGALCGVGTILNTSTLKKVIDYGVDYVVSPILDMEIISNCVAEGIPVVPGCMTPTEIHSAWKAGATVIKTFPGRVCTPSFYKDILGPFPDVKLLPTGNVNEHTAPEYLKCGAIGVGIGKALISDTLIGNKQWEKITNQAKHYATLLQ